MTMDGSYHLGNIHTLLLKGFSRDELLDFCFVTETYRPLYENWSQQNTLNDLVRSIVDRGNKQLALEEVLAWAAQLNPSRYHQHEPYFVAEAATQGAETSLVGILPGNDLGKGIELGGAYRDVPLRIAATACTSHGPDCEIRSGWLFVPQWTAGHAITFFKIHAYDDGTGYIHLVDVTNSAHPVFLATEADRRIEKVFHYVRHPSDFWNFVWRRS